MAGEEVFMDVPAVMAMGKRFEDIGNILKSVAAALEALMTVLKATAFIGLVGGLAVERYLAQFKPVIERLSEQCTEIGGDLAASARAYERGDAMGSTRFY